MSARPSICLSARKNSAENTAIFQQMSAGRPYFKNLGEKTFLLSRRALKFANSSKEINTNNETQYQNLLITQ